MLEAMPGEREVMVKVDGYFFHLTNDHTGKINNVSIAISPKGQTMTDTKAIDWLANLKVTFVERGLAGEDFYYVIKTMVGEGRISFLEMLSSAAQGHGSRVHEGLEFILEEDLDDPDDFDGAIFVIGEYESSILPIIDFVYLIELACRNYAAEFPDDESRVVANLHRIKSRYADASALK